MKKSKVVKLEQWATAKPDEHGNLPYNISFENGDEGMYRGNPNKGLKFSAGAEAEYEIEELTSKTGKTYFKVSPYHPPKEYGGWKPKMMSWNEVLEMARTNACNISRKIKHCRDEKFTDRVVKFITLGIPAGDIEMWGGYHRTIITRMATTKAVADTPEVKWSEDGYFKECIADVKYIQG